MKRDYKTPALVLLIVFMTLGVLVGYKMSNKVKELQEENKELTMQLMSQTDKLENQTNRIDELEKDHKRLTEERSKSTNNVAELKVAIDYKDFLDAINTIELYKEVKTFEAATEFIAFKMGNGRSTLDSSYTCPCYFIFNEKVFEWIPNAVLELKEISIEKEKWVLTYNTSEDIKSNYQFVMIKARGLNLNDVTEKWRIEEIILEDKV